MVFATTLALTFTSYWLNDMILDTESEFDGKQVWLMKLQGQNMILSKTFESICIDQTIEYNWRHKGCILQISDHWVNKQRLGVSLGKSWETYPKVKFAEKQTKGIDKGTTEKYLFEAELRLIWRWFKACFFTKL